MSEEIQEETETFLIEVTVKKCPSNEVEDWQADPNDFVEFLQKHVVSENAAYGLDAYNKDSSQLITGIRVAEK